MPKRASNCRTRASVIGGFCLLGVALAPPLFLNDFFAGLEQSQIELPLLSRAIMKASALIGHPLSWLALSFGLAGLFYAGKRLRYNPKARKELETLVLLTPGLGELYLKFCRLRFFRAFGLQLEAGLYLDRSLKLAAQVSGSDRFQEAIAAAVERIHAGESLAFSLQRTGIFDSTAIEFLKVGEETGKVPEMCRSIENLLAEETEYALEVAQSLLEPVTMAFLGVTTGLVAIGCLLPLIRMIESLA